MNADPLIPDEIKELRQLFTCMKQSVKDGETICADCSDSYDLEFGCEDTGICNLCAQTRFVDEMPKAIETIRLLANLVRLYSKFDRPRHLISRHHGCGGLAEFECQGCIEERQLDDAIEAVQSRLQEL